MSKDWSETTLGGICQVISGQSPKGETISSDSSGTPFYQGVKDFGYKFPTVTTWTSDPKKLAEKGDVLLSVRAPVGRVNVAAQRIAIGRGVTSLRPVNCDGSFLFQLLKYLEPDWKNWESAGSVFSNLSRGDIESMSVRIPPLDEQRRIAGVLGALDDLIEANRGLISDLDAALLASWQVKSSESTDSIAIGERVELSKGLSYKGAFLREDGLPMINMGSFGVDGHYRSVGLKWYDESQVKEKHLLVEDDLVVVNTDLTQSCDILARPILVPFKRATSTHHTFQLRVVGASAEKFWIYCALRQETIRKSLASHATGTTVAALPSSTLLAQEIPWADVDKIGKWWEIAEPFYRAGLELANENELLGQTRDELLPQLLSGRVRVGDIAA